MRITDISQRAKATLADIYMLSEYSKTEDKSLDDLLANLIDNINCESEKERDEYIDTLQELKAKEYIDINIEMENVPKIDAVVLKEKAKEYIGKYMKYEGNLTVAYKNELRDINDNLLKLSKSGYFIVGVAIVGLICEIINTIVNIFK